MTHSAGARWPVSALRQVFSPQPGILPALDGLRSAAVLLVILGHWATAWNEQKPAVPAATLHQSPLFNWGWTGVDLFFVLSGYLIGRQLWKELYGTGSVKLRDFVIRRGLRIWPLYYATLVALFLFSTTYKPIWADWVMVSNYWQSPFARSWSLSTEEQFYLVMPALLLVLRRSVRETWWPACILALIALVPAMRYVTYAHYAAQGIDTGRILGYLMYSPFHLHSEALLAGLLVAWISVKRPAWLEPALTNRPAWKVIGAAGVTVVLGVSLRVLHKESFSFFALACLYSGMLCIALVDRSFLTAPLRWRGWFVIARLSFGMYLNHLLFGSLVATTITAALRTFPGNANLASLSGLLVSIAFSALLATLSYVLIEYPGLQVRDRVLTEHPGAIRHVAPPPPFAPGFSSEVSSHRNSA